jgi:DNA-directed RNA polymerase subunit F
MLDNRSPLMKRLAEIMPKNPEQPWEPWDGKYPMHIELHPIRQSADAFASWINDELPSNDEELRAMLWTFGEILDGHMERMLNESNRLRGDLLDAMPIKPQMIHVSEIGEVTEEQMKAMASVPPNPTLKFDHFSIPKYNRDNAIATVTARITDEIRSILSNTKGESVSGQDVKQTPKIIKSGKDFYYCSECKNASNKPEGIPHSQTCSLPDLCKKP